MKHQTMAILLTALSASATAAPEPIHRDEDARPTITLPPASMNPNHKTYVVGHLETRHVDPRPKAECFELTHGVVNEDFMKCRNGYDYKVYIQGHFED